MQKTYPANRHHCYSTADLSDLIRSCGLTPGEVKEDEHIKVVYSVEKVSFYPGIRPAMVVWLDSVDALNVRRNDQPEHPLPPAARQRIKRAIDEEVSLDEWLDRWAAEVESGQSTISRAEAIKRFRGQT